MQKSGFTLIELMIVVAILGILSSIASVQFRVFTAKSKRAEVKTMFAHLYTIQQTYYSANNHYAGTGTWYGGKWGTCYEQPSLDYMASYFGLSNDSAACANFRYSYFVSGGTSSFEVIATSTNLFPKCDISDRWTMDHNKIIANTIDAATGCN